MKLEAELEIPILLLVIFHRPQFVKRPWNIQVLPMQIFIVEIIIFNLRPNQNYRFCHVYGSTKCFEIVTNATGAIFGAEVRIFIPLSKS